MVARWRAATPRSPWSPRSEPSSPRPPRRARAPRRSRSRCTPRASTAARSTGSPARARARPCAASRAAAGLVVDGIAGPATRRALGRRGRPALGTRAIARGDRGWDVAALQFLLETHGFPLGPVDGVLGPRSVAALVRFQYWAGLAADGVAGPATLARLRGPPPRSILRFAWPMHGAGRRRLRAARHRLPPGLDFPAPAGTPVRPPGAAASPSPAGTRAATATS